jgi:hypothetical protein
VILLQIVGAILLSSVLAAGFVFSIEAIAQRSARAAAAKAMRDSPKQTAATIAVPAALILLLWQAFAATVLSAVSASVLVLLIEAVSNRSLRAASRFLLGSPREAAVTIGALAAAGLLLDGILGRPLLGLIAIAPLLLGLAWINHEKAQHLLEPLYPSDFLFVRQVLDLLPSLARARTAAILTGLVLFAGAVTFLVLAREVVAAGVAWNWSSRVAMGVGGLVILWTFAYAAQPHGWWLLDMIDVPHRIWNPREQYQKNGLILALAINMRGLTVVPPQRGHELVMRDLAVGTGAGRARAAPPDPAGAAADVVVFACEAFWDPTRLPGVELSPDPMPHVRALSVGEIFSPTFGGNTANAELEALTGFSNAFLPHGTIAYQQYIRTRTPSLVWYLRNRGYLTLAMHPYHKWFWNRQAAYPNLGFERFLGLDELGSLPQVGGHVSDLALARAVAAQVDAASRPAFVFALTMENHSPYPADRYPPGITVTSNLPKDDAAIVRTYAEGVRAGDAALGELIAWARGRKRPTIIAFFGDHLPLLGGGALGVYAQTAFVRQPPFGKDVVMADLRRLREGPLVLWSSMREAGDQIGTMGLSFTPYVLLKALGLEHPFYTEFLGRLWSEYRVIDRKLLMTRDNRLIEDWLPASSQVLKEYHLIQYDVMFGERKLASRFFD